MRRASDLLGCRVVTESGEARGQVFELRAKEENDGLRLIGLGVSTSGALERFGVTGARRPEPILAGDLFRWEDVVDVDAANGWVIVRDGARPV